ncbi:hypothetical protein NDU88_004045 [Pleurodeles waltl]|uniref:Uncharacterized protein n=1 Tax=Pleurodeles waltl TaxID=8319 RepID=A0AAV7NI94_PLEWA|nr:hypothetical protein NDU88_004045 [Pleurodeles waltl]
MYSGPRDPGRPQVCRPQSLAAPAPPLPRAATNSRGSSRCAEGGRHLSPRSPRPQEIRHSSVCPRAHARGPTPQPGASGGPSPRRISEALFRPPRAPDSDPREPGSAQAVPTPRPRTQRISYGGRFRVDDGGVPSTLRVRPPS